MNEKIPNFYVESVDRQKEKDPHPYDAIVSIEEGKDKIGHVADNFVCQVLDKSGEHESTLRIPITVSYFKKGGSDSWYKKIYGYRDGVDSALDSSEMEYYVVFDPVSGLSFLAMPIDEKTEVVDNIKSLDLFFKNGRPQDTELLREFLQEFPTVQFGLTGSKTFNNLIIYHVSDIDLIVYGPENLSQIVDTIENDPDMTNRIGMKVNSDERILKDTVHYMNKFNLSELEAKIIATRKRRYILKSGIKLSLNCALSAEDSLKDSGPMVIGSKKVGDVSIEATALDVKLSSALPRRFSVDVDGQNVDVVSSMWSLKDLIRAGDKVKIEGVMRENDGNVFISLENKGHIIKPIIK